VSANINTMADLQEQMTTHNDLCLYLDFYGQLLTDHCRAVLEMHLGEDMSLGEIAENLGVSRQAVHDRVRQGIYQLTEYEQVLGLAARHQAELLLIHEAIAAIDGGQTDQARQKMLQLAADL
jgi:uncharacterized protein